MIFKTKNRSHCLIKYYTLILYFLIVSSCNKTKHSGSKTRGIAYPINKKIILNDTIDFKNPKVLFLNGVYFFNDKVYSGVVFKELKGYKVKTYSTVLDGKLNGMYQSFYENGNPYEIRHYKNNMSFGRQLGYWKSTGKLKFEYHYVNDKKEGLQKSWYENGDLAYIYNFKNDKQDGLQQAWRKNRSLYRNFEVKHGARYGLQKSKSCIELKDEKVIKRGFNDSQTQANTRARDSSEKPTARRKEVRGLVTNSPTLFG